MKKTVSALAASAVLVVGAGAIGSSAIAAPYPASIDATAIIARSADTTEGKIITFAVYVVAGNVVVNDGTVTVVFGGKKVVVPVSGGKALIRIQAPSVSDDTDKTIKAYYKPAAGSVFVGDSAAVTIEVKDS